MVDSSVWIDFLNGNETPQVRELKVLVEGEHQVCVTGLVLTEVLQGISGEPGAERVTGLLESFPMLEMTSRSDFQAAASLYRRARRSGITIRNKNDLLIAWPCIRESAWLLHSDRDFDLLASCSDLKVWKPTA